MRKSPETQADFVPVNSQGHFAPANLLVSASLPAVLLREDQLPYFSAFPFQRNRLHAAGKFSFDTSADSSQAASADA
jgi:hypothetical protein